jgi:hypothetical protein
MRPVYMPFVAEKPATDWPRTNRELFTNAHMVGSPTDVINESPNNAGTKPTSHSEGRHMLDSQASAVRTGDDEARPRIYSPEVQPLLQSLLATLADLDFDYERERERISRSTQDSNRRGRLLRKLADKHRERRDPYIRHLTVLQARITPLR